MSKDQLNVDISSARDNKPPSSAGDAIVDLSKNVGENLNTVKGNADKIRKKQADDAAERLAITEAQQKAEQLNQDQATLGSSSILDIRKNTKLLTNKEGSTDPEKIQFRKEEAQRRINAYSTEKEDGWRELNYQAVGGSKHEFGIGLGEIWGLDPDYKFLEVKDKEGNITIVERGIYDYNGQKRLGYGTSTGYFKSFSKFQVRKHEFAMTDISKPEQVTDYMAKLKEDKEIRDKYTKESANSFTPSLDRSEEKLSESSESKSFTDSIATFESNGKTYFHLVRKAKLEPENGKRDFEGKWDKEVVLEWATQLEKKYGIPKLMIISTSIYESGAGGSSQNRLSYELGNYYGIKPGGRSKRMLNKYKKAHPDQIEVVDTVKTGKQKHMHYADKFSSFDNYARLIATGRRYKIAMKHTDNPLTAMAIVALRGYCPGVKYIYELGHVMRRQARKFNLPLGGKIKYDEVMKALAEQNREGYTKAQIHERLRPALSAGLLDYMPLDT